MSNDDGFITSAAVVTRREAQPSPTMEVARRADLVTPRRAYSENGRRASTAAERQAVTEAYLAERAATPRKGIGSALKAEREYSMDTARAWLAAHLDTRRAEAAGRPLRAPTRARAAAAAAISGPKDRREHLSATAKTRAASARHR